MLAAACARGRSNNAGYIAEVLGIENPAKNLAKVLERAVDLALEAKDPQRRLARREARARKREAALQSRNAVGAPRPDEVAIGSGTAFESVAKQPENQPSAAPESAESTPAKSRHEPAAVRGRVLERTGHQCQFTGPDGTRCTARTGLEIEHTKPFAIFHSHDESPPEGVCSLCRRRHNVVGTISCERSKLTYRSTSKTKRHARLTSALRNLIQVDDEF